MSALMDFEVRLFVVRIGELIRRCTQTSVPRRSLHESGADSNGVLICAGTLRGDSVYGPGIFPGPKLKAMDSSKATGEITPDDILEILPFEDPIVPDCVRVPCYIGLFKTEKLIGSYRTHFS